MGRAARNVNGRVILYADNITGSMRRAIDETNRRRALQIDYNKEHHITPATIKKKISSIIDHEITPKVAPEYEEVAQDIEDIPKIVKEKEQEMKQLARDLKFEEAALVRDEVNQLKKLVRK
jgi:excinuclease ABC subunit B